MSRFWLLRHGPTHAKCMVGWSDLPADLSDKAALARIDAALPADALVISSDLSRAVATADALKPRMRLAHDPRLREMHFGRWEMRSHAEVERESPALLRTFWDCPGPTCAPEGESWDALTTRVWQALDALEGRAEDIIIVAHFGPILAALQRALKASPLEVFRHRIDNLSLTCLEQRSGCGASGVAFINHLS